MFLALALTTLLSADEPAADPEALTAADESVVHSEQQREDDRVVRIGATALGGALGIAMPLLLGWAWMSANGRCTFSCDVPMGVMSSFLPLTAALGLALPHDLRGGRAGVGFGLAGMLAGYITATGALAIGSVLSNTRWTATAPLPGAGLAAALSLVGAVAALELRHSELEAGAAEWKVGRAFAEGAVFWLPAVVSEGLFVLGSFSVSNVGGGALSVVLLAAGSAATLGLATAAAWGTHRALDGRGSFWSAMVGALASSSVASLFLAIHAVGPPDGGLSGSRGGTTMIIPLAAFTALIAVVGPSAGLEWSSARATGPRLEPSENESRKSFTDHLQLQAGFTPRGDATFGLSGSF
jgi:hypothetical protein